MKNFVLFVSLFFSLSALAAPGDRYLKNTNADKDLSLCVTKTGTGESCPVTLNGVTTDATIAKFATGSALATETQIGLMGIGEQLFNGSKHFNSGVFHIHTQDLGTLSTTPVSLSVPVYTGASYRSYIVSVSGQYGTGGNTNTAIYFIRTFFDSAVTWASSGTTVVLIAGLNSPNYVFTQSGGILHINAGSAVNASVSILRLGK